MEIISCREKSFPSYTERESNVVQAVLWLGGLRLMGMELLEGILEGLMTRMLWDGGRRAFTVEVDVGWA